MKTPEEVAEEIFINYLFKSDNWIYGMDNYTSEIRNAIIQAIIADRAERDDHHKNCVKDSDRNWQCDICDEDSIYLRCMDCVNKEVQHAIAKRNEEIREALTIGGANWYSLEWLKDKLLPEDDKK